MSLVDDICPPYSDRGIVARTVRDHGAVPLSQISTAARMQWRDASAAVDWLLDAGVLTLDGLTLHYVERPEVRASNIERVLAALRVMPGGGTTEEIGIKAVLSSHDASAVLVKLTKRGVVEIVKRAVKHGGRMLDLYLMKKVAP